ncbi:PH domain-containing protein [Parasphingorhabdus pacifica]
MSSAELPEDAAWQRLDERTILATAVLMCGFAISAAVPATIGISRGTGIGVALAWVFPGALLLIAAGTVIEWLRWRATTYRVTDERLELRFDLIASSHRTLRRERVRTVDVTAKPVFRLFGMAELTAGTGQGSDEGDRIKLAPLARGQAERLRRELLGYSQPDEEPRPPLATLDWRWMAYAPVSFLAPALGFAALFGVLQVSDWIGLRGWLVDQSVQAWQTGALVFVLIALVVVSVLVGVLAALALFIEQWWNYRLERETEDTLRVRRGLFTSRSISVEERRLRGVDLAEPLGNRLLGAARVHAVATGMRQENNNKGPDYGTLLPAAPRRVADRVAADVLREPVAPTSSARLRPHPPAARAKRLRWAVAVVLAVCAVPAVLGLLLTTVLLHVAWIAAVVLLPMAVLIALDAYRNLGHGISGDYLVVRSGTVPYRSTVALQRSGVIGWRLKQSVFQRRAGLLTVTAITAAGAGGYAAYDTDEQDGVSFADAAVPGLLEQFLERD